MTHDAPSHTHESDPPAKQGTGCVFGKEKWSQQEWARVKQLKERGYTIEAISLIVGRSKEQVKGKIRWETMSEENRQARRDRLNAYRAENRKIKKPHPPVMSHRAPPAELLVERAARLSAPQTMTGMFFGDPPPGWSALDRKRSSHP